jgi:hypothetical protein
VLAEGNVAALPTAAPIAETILHGQQAKDVEPKGLRKIEVNHDTDKAEGKKKHPALARSETHDVGRAEVGEGIVNHVNLQRITKLQRTQLIEELRKRTGR